MHAMYFLSSSVLTSMLVLNFQHGGIQILVSLIIPELILEMQRLLSICITLIRKHLRIDFISSLYVKSFLSNHIMVTLLNVIMKTTDILCITWERYAQNVLNNSHSGARLDFHLLVTHMM